MQDVLSSIRFALKHLEQTMSHVDNGKDLIGKVEGNIEPLQTIRQKLEEQRDALQTLLRTYENR